VVSVVIPMYNELTAIEECLKAFETQTYPLDLLDVIVVDGASTDGSRQVVDATLPDRPWLRIVDNPARCIPAGCNVGLGAAKGDVVCIFSSHGVASPTYVEQSVAVLSETDAAGVGGTCRHVGLDAASRAIGLAMSSPVGMASRHRFARTRQPIDTISHPAYWLQPVLEAGGFDEQIERNEDYELNWRLRQRGLHLVFDPSITSTYRPRSSLAALSRQFFWYGWWKAKVVGQHRGSLRVRHLVPPAAVVAAITAPVVLTSRRGRRLAGLGAVGYATVVAVGLVGARPASHGASRRTVIAAFPIMHFCWGAGFAGSIIDDLRPRRAAAATPPPPAL
jgi:succinoglycan biosynthesis protein ExoA